MRPGVPHHDMRRVHQRIELWPHRLAAAQRQDFDVLREARQAAQFFAHLIGQLAGGTEHQRLRGNLSNDDVIQQTNAERRRFTATGFALARTSRPCRMAGNAAACTGVILAYPSSLRLANCSAGRGREEKETVLTAITLI